VSTAGPAAPDPVDVSGAGAAGADRAAESRASSTAADAGTAPATAPVGAPRRRRRASVIVASTRASTGVYDDRTGPLIRDWMLDRGFEVGAVVVVADGPPVENALRAAIDAGDDLLVTSGGTGVSPTDMTADATAPLLTAQLPGFAEELRRRGSTHTPFALMSRGLAGVAGRTFVVNLPGSPGGVRDGLGLLGEVVDHVLDQLSGGDHD